MGIFHSYISLPEGKALGIYPIVFMGKTVAVLGGVIPVHIETCNVMCQVLTAPNYVKIPGEEYGRTAFFLLCLTLRHIPLKSCR